MIMKKRLTKELEGDLQAKGLNFGIVCSRFNDFFVTQLLDGAVNTIVRHGGSVDDITIAWVPGAFEIPMAANQMAVSNNYDSIIALGVVIQGATSHAGFINTQVTNSLAKIGLETNIPVIFGIVTAENLEQAIERSGSKAGNRGASAAASAIEMANLMKTLNNNHL
jgi:6,7-dimethyl-8-ribityllumazine synthase